MISTSFYSQSQESIGITYALTWLFCAASWFHSVHYVFMCGAQDFSRIESAESSPYAVGLRRIKISEK